LHTDRFNIVGQNIGELKAAKHNRHDVFTLFKSVSDFHSNPVAVVYAAVKAPDRADYQNVFAVVNHIKQLGVKTAGVQVFYIEKYAVTLGGKAVAEQDCHSFAAVPPVGQEDVVFT
jgi:hypothetical protein